MMVVQEDRKDAVLLAMCDQYMRRILCSIMSEGKSIEQISRENAIPMSTCYRRIHELLKFRLVRIERMIITPEGKKYETFRSAFTDPKISLSSGDFSVEITPLRVSPEDALHSMWMATKGIVESSNNQQSLSVLEI